MIELQTFPPKVKKYSEELANNPDSLAFAPLADAYREQGMLDEAIEMCKRGLEYHPDYGEAHLVLGRVYLEKDMWEEAKKEFDLVLKLRLDDPLAHAMLGYIYSQKGLREEASEEYKACLELDPNNKAVIKALKEIQEKYGRGKGEIEERIKEEKPSRASIQTESAISISVDRVSKEDIEAREKIEKALEELRMTRGINMSALVKEDGTIVALKGRRNTTTIGLSLASFLQAMRGSLEKISLGDFKNGLLETEKGRICITTVISAILAISAEKMTKLGLILLKVKKATNIIENVLTKSSSFSERGEASGEDFSPPLKFGRGEAKVNPQYLGKGTFADNKTQGSKVPLKEEAKILSGLEGMDGVLGSMLLKRDGTILASDMMLGLQEDVVSEISRDIYLRAEQIGEETGQARLNFASLEAKAGRMLLAGLEDDILVILATKDINLGQIRLTLRQRQKIMRR